ncbi:MAG: type II toxin-antitoxin system RelE/ParE family toxin [Actinomycetota bacterium]|nr:type II toxin-antitoxin system RelE/ParE family toxin [Actinomycetota bacterium]
MEWEVIAHPEVERWINELDASSQIQLVAALRILREEGPSLGRPLVDRIKGSVIHNLKELRPGSKGLSEIRVLFVFDRDRQAILLVGGDKQNRWSRWYKSAIPLAQERYEQYLN